MTQRLDGRNCRIKTQFSADDFADFFTSEVDEIRASTSRAPSPRSDQGAVIVIRRFSTAAKKPTMDDEVANSYRSISNLSLISKFVERIVAMRITPHADRLKLFPSNQS